MKWWVEFRSLNPKGVQTRVAAASDGAGVGFENAAMHDVLPEQPQSDRMDNPASMTQSANTHEAG